ncbi:hypothetical protein K0M31_001459 [Melipona bicolor]|uniref:Uncharacterized protein n=1 Tax=Melipona bicolor TaxID=60889 RepID=A0AA40GFU8_9HYME|nr:hypothetical protein K0M31_001459 [Melipona bicolor]
MARVTSNLPRLASPCRYAQQGCNLSQEDVDEIRDYVYKSRKFHYGDRSSHSAGFQEVKLRNGPGGGEEGLADETGGGGAPESGCWDGAEFTIFVHLGPNPLSRPEPGPSFSPLFFSSSLLAHFSTVLCVPRSLLYFVSRLSLTFSPLPPQRFGEDWRGLETLKIGGSLNDFFWGGPLVRLIISWFLEFLTNWEFQYIRAIIMELKCLWSWLNWWFVGRFFNESGILMCFYDNSRVKLVISWMIFNGLGVLSCF